MASASVRRSAASSSTAGTSRAEEDDVEAGLTQQQPERGDPHVVALVLGTGEHDRGLVRGRDRRDGDRREQFATENRRGEVFAAQ